jgi:hypothetical protein
MNKEKAINYWFNMADYDLKTSQVMLDGGRYLLEKTRSAYKWLKSKKK